MSDFWTRFDAMMAEALATEEGKAFAAAGFELYANGGNCTAWRKPWGDGGHILVTNDDGSNHFIEVGASPFVDTDSDSYLIGFYLSDNDTDPASITGPKTAASAIAAAERGPVDKIGVDVWIAGTIYVDAATEEEAARIVKERYAGSRDSSLGYDHMSGNDLPMDGDDFMSSATTLYGLCSESALLAANDDLRDAAPDLLAALKLLRECVVSAKGNFAVDDHKAQIALRAANSALTKAAGQSSHPALHPIGMNARKYLNQSGNCATLGDRQMPTHQPSNIATYSDASGAPVFDTFFVLSDWGNGEELFAFQSPGDQVRGMAAFEAKGFASRTVSHQDAFMHVRGGMRAWVHNGDVPSDMIWSPIKINFPARVA